MSCEIDAELLAAHAAGDLTPAEADRIEDHVAACPTCHERLAAIAAVDAALAALPRRDPGEEARLRLRRRLHAECAAPEPEILTLDEVAALLRLSREELETGLDALPVFEVAGRLRVRRRALEDWIAAREYAHHRAVAASWAAAARSHLVG